MKFDWFVPLQIFVQIEVKDYPTAKITLHVSFKEYSVYYTVAFEQPLLTLGHTVQFTLQ